MPIQWDDPNLRGLMVDDLVTGRRPLSVGAGDLSKRVLFSSTLPVGIAPSGSMANNGALTAGTALWQAFSASATGGIWLYFPADAIFTGSAAGFYWTVMTNTTAGTVYNNTYTPAAGTLPSIPATPVAFSTTGPGAYTGVTDEITVMQATIPSYLQKVNAFYDTQFAIGYHNSSGTKTIRSKNGSTVTGTYTTSNNSVNIFHRWMFTQALEPVVNFMAPGAASPSGGLTMVSTQVAGDTTHSLTLQTDTATQTLYMISACIEATVP